MTIDEAIARVDAIADDLGSGDENLGSLGGRTARLDEEALRVVLASAVRAAPILAVLDASLQRGGIRVEPILGCRLTLWPSVFDDDHWHVAADTVEDACRKALAAYRMSAGRSCEGMW